MAGPAVSGVSYATEMRRVSSFSHLRVSSGYSLRYGASHPDDLVAQAAKLGMSAMGLVDRNGLYGAVKFASACQRHQINPVIGVDLGLSSGRSAKLYRAGATPSRGGSFRPDPPLRVCVLARPGGGWGALCALVTTVHESHHADAISGSLGGHAVSGKVRLPHLATASFEQLVDAASDGSLMVMLGSDSPLGSLVTSKDHARATAELRRWIDAVGLANLVIAPRNFRAGGCGPGSAIHAARMVALADELGVRSILVNDVRMVSADQLAVVDVLDATRNRIPISGLVREAAVGQAWLKPIPEMVALADEVGQRAGRRDRGRGLCAMTQEIAQELSLDPAVDVGLGQIHLPRQSESDYAELSQRCWDAIPSRFSCSDPVLLAKVEQRLAEELGVIKELGFPAYFLTVADVVDFIRRAQIRCTARGSGAGSLVNYLLSISGVDPISNNLLMERFLSIHRTELPDIDLDVESARRLEIYQMITKHFGRDRVVCVGMFDTYRARSAIRDVGAALSLAPADVDQLAKAFPRVRANQITRSLDVFPELRPIQQSLPQWKQILDIAAALDGLPGNLAMHPCGVIIGPPDLGQLTPHEPSLDGFPVSQFDKHDVEAAGLLKLDVLGVRMQSALSFAVDEIERSVGERIDIDGLAPFADPATYQLISSTHTLGCFQIESPGQRELVGRFGPENFTDVVIDISLFRPGPVKSDMVTPFLQARHGLKEPHYAHPSLRSILAETGGVVVFHEQVIRLISTITGVPLSRGDQVRRLLGNPEDHQRIGEWFFAQGRHQGYSDEMISHVWEILVSFASFGFCRAHAAAFAVPTYQSAWLKTHYPAAFLAGVLTHDPGMYPKRLLLNEARRMGIRVGVIDINRSRRGYHAHKLGIRSVLGDAGDESFPGFNTSGLPNGDGWFIQPGLMDIRGISSAELDAIVAGQPYRSLTDFCQRARVSRPVLEDLIMVGAFDELYRCAERYSAHVAAPAALTRRDLLLRSKELVGFGDAHTEVDLLGNAESRSTHVFLPTDVPSTQLPKMDEKEIISAELDVCGMDISGHVLDPYRQSLGELIVDGMPITWASELRALPPKSDVLVVGAKVATQTPPVKSGQRVVFVTVDDGTGPIDVNFFSSAQERYAHVIFQNWLLILHGKIRRTGKNGLSLTGVRAWPLLDVLKKRGLADHGCPASKKMWWTSPMSSGQ